jgi:hypothetical protein
VNSVHNILELWSFHFTIRGRNLTDFIFYKEMASVPILKRRRLRPNKTFSWTDNGLFI